MYNRDEVELVASARETSQPHALEDRTVALPESENRQRATTQTSQGLDATHGNEMFPVAGNESRFDTYFR